MLIDNSLRQAIFPLSTVHSSLPVVRAAMPVVYKCPERFSAIFVRNQYAVHHACSAAPTRESLSSYLDSYMFVDIDWKSLSTDSTMWRLISYRQVSIPCQKHFVSGTYYHY
jgi:hypothetical protein